MMTSRITIMTVCLLCLVGATALTSNAATSFNGSTIVSIDQAQRTITFQTREGENWTLPVADPDILKEVRISKGDQVSIEIDPNDKITKILKASEPSPSPQSQSRDEMSR
jgi:hypothetical protein